MNDGTVCVNCIIKSVEIARLQAILDAAPAATWRRRSLAAWRARIERAALLAEVDAMRGAGADVMEHIVALSGGKDSTAMALRLAAVEPRAYTYLCTPTGDENDETVAHWAHRETLLGREIVRLTNGTLDRWIAHFDALPSHRMRWCTRLLKIEPTMAYLAAHAPATHYVGLRADEPNAQGSMASRWPSRTTRCAAGAGACTEVVGYLRERGVRIPQRTNCRRCYEQQLPEWKRLWLDDPATYEAAAAQERAVGADVPQSYA